METAKQERLRAYGFLLIFVLAVVVFGYLSAGTIREATISPMPATPLLIGAVAISLATVVPLVVTFRPSAAASMLSTMQERARRSGNRNRKVTLQSAGRTVSMYVAALAGTPALYGLMLQFLVGEFQLLLLLLPASAILAAVGWVVLGRFFRALETTTAG